MIRTSVFSKIGAALATLALVMVLVFAPGPTAMAQSGQLPSAFVNAMDYNNWSIQSQAPNTYTFNTVNACQNTPQVSGVPTPYFVFGQLAQNVGYPVLIQDPSPALSEIVTPTSLSTSASACGFSASTVNQHAGFTLLSGTAGLEDAVGSLYNASAGLQPINVYIDYRFYQAVAALPGSKLPIELIHSIPTGVGSNGVQIVDTTTTPFSIYVWNGAQYQLQASPAALDNVNYSSLTNIAAPTALTTATSAAGMITTATTGGTIPASSTYRLGATCVDSAGGETSISTDSASTSTIATGATATNTISVSSPSCGTGSVGYRLYMSAASGASLSEILYTPSCNSSGFTQPYLETSLVHGTVCKLGQNATISAIVTGTAKIPTINTAFPRTGGTSGVYATFPATGAQATTVAGTAGLVNLHTGFLNSLGKTIEVCGAGYATVNGTPGTLTISLTLASVPGVTSITPFTAVSGTTSASATVNYDFCVTMTTAATGATGTLETHGWVKYGVAGTAVATSSIDTTTAVSSTIDLTKQDQLSVLITPTTTGITAAQLRQLTVWSAL